MVHLRAGSTKVTFYSDLPRTQSTVLDHYPKNIREFHIDLFQYMDFRATQLTATKKRGGGLSNVQVSRHNTHSITCKFILTGLHKADALKTYMSVTSIHRALKFST